MSARISNSVLMGAVGFFAGLIVAAFAIAICEMRDDRLKTVADVERITGLPVLAALGDLNAMSQTEREQWAFRTWTALSGQLSHSANHGLVCGIVSSTKGEGRSTWINLLAGAASQRGLRVLAVATGPDENGRDVGQANCQEPMPPSQSADDMVCPPGPQMQLALPVALTSPEEIARQLARPDAPPVAHLPLSGWVWNLERRKQWQSALARWQRLDNLVMLIELPPASEPESVLLAENLPQVIWLADSGKSRAPEARQQLETLRHAKCRLACAVLNHQPDGAFKL